MDLRGLLIGKGKMLRLAHPDELLSRRGSPNAPVYATEVKGARENMNLSGRQGESRMDHPAKVVAAQIPRRRTHSDSAGLVEIDVGINTRAVTGKRLLSHRLRPGRLHRDREWSWQVRTAKASRVARWRELAPPHAMQLSKASSVRTMRCFPFSFVSE
jgi:hypothetical protein